MFYFLYILLFLKYSLEERKRNPTVLLLSALFEFLCCGQTGLPAVLPRLVRSKMALWLQLHVGTCLLELLTSLLPVNVPQMWLSRYSCTRLPAWELPGHHPQAIFSFLLRQGLTTHIALANLDHFVL